MDQRVGFVEVPFGVGLVPHAVEPDAAEGAVVGKKFGKLAVHVGVEVGVPVTVIGASVGPVGGASRIIVGIVPIELRIIEEQLDALAVAFVGEHLQRVFLVGCAGDDIPV